MEQIWDIVITVLVVISGLFGLIGSYGLIKLPDPMTRLHAPTKAATLGVGCVLLASMVYFATKTDAPSYHELLITLFLFMTAPVSGLMIAKVNLIRSKRVSPMPDDTEWAFMVAQAKDAVIDESD